MWNGIQALENLDNTLKSVRTETVRLDTQLGQLNQRVTVVEQRRLKLVHEIARVRLNALNNGDLDAQLSAADVQAQQIVQQREAALAQLNSRIDQQQADIERIEAQRTVAAEKVSEVVQRILEEERSQSKYLGQDSTYQALLTEAHQAEQMASESVEKVARAKADMTEKALPFRADALFMYLWERGYGTTGYEASFLARWLDGKVAKLIDFEPARVNYWNLIEIPRRLEHHAQSVSDAAETKAQAVLDYAEQHRAQSNIPEWEGEEAKAREALQALDSDLEAQEIALNELLEQRNLYLRGEDSFTHQCLSLLSQAMDHRDIDSVYRFTLMTASTSDDELVLELSELDQQSQSIKADLTGLRRVHERQLQRLREIEDVRGKFKSSRFDDVRSRFSDSGLLASLLAQFAQGLVSGSEIWQTLERNHQVQSNSMPKSHADALDSILLPGQAGGSRQRRRHQQSSWNWPKAKPSARPASTNSSSGRFKTGGSF